MASLQTTGSRPQIWDALTRGRTQAKARALTDRASSHAPKNKAHSIQHTHPEVLACQSFQRPRQDT
jgi:hypothetical protein